MVDSDAGGWAKKPQESTWGERSTSAEKDQNSLGWGKKEQIPWGKKVNDEQNDWTKISEQSTSAEEAQNSSAWGKKVGSDSGGWAKKDEQSKWVNVDTSKSESKPAWSRDTPKEDVLSPRPQEDGLWSSASGARSSQEASGENPWAAKVADQETPEPSKAWGSSNDWAKLDSQSPKGEENESPIDKWGSTQKQSGENDARPQWGRGRGRGRGWGRGGRSREGFQGRGPPNDREWKDRKSRSVDDPNAPGLFTVTNKRLDSFTTEEQDVLSETESIMKNIKRIMHQSG